MAQNNNYPAAQRLYLHQNNAVWRAEFPVHNQHGCLTLINCLCIPQHVVVYIALISLINYLCIAVEYPLVLYLQRNETLLNKLL
jgi:hypothetical protein